MEGCNLSPKWLEQGDNGGALSTTPVNRISFNYQSCVHTHPYYMDILMFIHRQVPPSTGRTQYVSCLLGSSSMKYKVNMIVFSFYFPPMVFLIIARNENNI